MKRLKFVFKLVLCLTCFSVSFLKIGYKTKFDLINFSVFIFLILTDVFLYFYINKKENEEDYLNLCLSGINELKMILSKYAFANVKEEIINELIFDLKYCCNSSEDYQKMYDKIVELILCSEKINELKIILNKLPISINTKEKIINEITFDLNCCASVESFQEVYKKTVKLIYYYKNYCNYYTNIYPDIISSLSILNLPLNIKKFEEIEKQYKKLIKQYHPDINHEEKSEEKAKQINIAYEYLKKNFSVKAI